MPSDAKLANPISGLTKDEVRWEPDTWTDLHQQAFDALKASTAKLTHLHLFDPYLQYYLLYDASTTRLAYALYQLVGEDLVPVSSGGRVLTKRETRLHPSDLELMAAAEGVIKFRLWIESCTLPTKAYTDSTAVLYWNTQLLCAQKPKIIRRVLDMGGG